MCILGFNKMQLLTPTITFSPNSVKIFQQKIRWLRQKKSLTFAEFHKKHVTARTYFFQAKKCEDQSWPHHKRLRSNYAVVAFPDSVLNHYKESVYPEEKYLPSILQNVEKSSHGIPFSLTAQTAKNRAR